MSEPVAAEAAVQQPAAPAGPPPRYWALWHAVVAERERRTRGSILVSTLAGLVAVFAFGASILPDAVTRNLVVGWLVFLVIQGVVLALVLLRDTGGDFGQAQVVGEFARRGVYRDWKEKTGEDAPPLTPKAAADWLARHADDGELIGQRLHAQLIVGDLLAARETLARYPRGTAEERYAYASDAWFVDFLAGGDGEPDGPLALAAAIEDSDERARAIAGIATMQAGLAVAQGGDWVPPMAAHYPEVAGRIVDDWRLPIMVRTWTMTMAVTSALVGVALLVAGWLGVLPV